MEETASHHVANAPGPARALSWKDTPAGQADRPAEGGGEPAYKRRGVALDNTPHSSESSVSRYSLNEEENAEGEKEMKLRDNNPFLHDNVD